MQIHTLSKSIPACLFVCIIVVLPTAIQAQVKAQQASTAKDTKASEHVTRHNPLYRDYSPTPLDPRKPCSVCSRPADCKAQPKFDLPGLRGRPHLDNHLGGCKCGEKHPDRHPMFNWNWPQPFSALREEKHPGFSGWLEDPCRSRLTHFYDKLGDIKLAPYRRTDNGYTGMARDPYGCLGESRAMQSGVRGLQFRQPGEPVFGSPTFQPATQSGFGSTSGYPLNGNQQARQLWNDFQPVRR